MDTVLMITDITDEYLDILGPEAVLYYDEDSSNPVGTAQLPLWPWPIRAAEEIVASGRGKMVEATYLRTKEELAEFLHRPDLLSQPPNNYGEWRVAVQDYCWENGSHWCWYTTAGKWIITKPGTRKTGAAQRA